jgi:hypothetical protein
LLKERKSTLGAVRRNGKKVHIKPLLKQKDFIGHVYYPEGVRYRYTPVNILDFPGNYKVLCSEEVEFSDELRFVILNKTVVGEPSDADYYFVDYSALYKFVKNIVKAYTSAPPAYVIDVGFMRPMDSPMFPYTPALVEINSAWSASLDGTDIAPEDFVRVLETSWNHLMQG